MREASGIRSGPSVKCFRGLGVWVLEQPTTTYYYYYYDYYYYYKTLLLLLLLLYLYLHIYIYARSKSLTAALQSPKTLHVFPNSTFCRVEPLKSRFLDP